MSLAEIRKLSLDQVNTELGAGGHYSKHNELGAAREALVAMLKEYRLLRDR